MKKTADELAAELAEALEELKGNAAADLSQVWNSLYTVDARLSAHIDKLEAHIKKPTKQSTKEAGPLLEQIALLAFAGLNGFPNISAVRTATSQHDLLVTGDGKASLAFCNLVRVNPAHRGILVECKAEKSKVGDPQMRRLCSIVGDHFPKIVGLAVFLTIKGATGYSTAGKEVRRIGEARLTQVLANAKHGKPIIVLDWDDIRTLTRPGSLPYLLKQRIQELESMGAVHPAAPFDCPRVDLPAHLLALYTPPSPPRVPPLGESD